MCKENTVVLRSIQMLTTDMDVHVYRSFLTPMLTACLPSNTTSQSRNEGVQALRGKKSQKNVQSRDMNKHAHTDQSTGQSITNNAFQSRCVGIDVTLEEHGRRKIGKTSIAPE